MNSNTKETPLLTARFETALVYATQLHAQQLRKGSAVPYISHLLSVAALVLEDGGDEDQAIAALLHDAVEDRGGAKTLEAIRYQFGERVANIVDGCTETDIMPKPPWRDRKLQYLEKLRHAPAEVLRVSMADKLHNARSILADWHQHGNAIWSKFKGAKEGTLWFYRASLDIYHSTGSSFLLKELDWVISELEQLN